MTGKSSVLLVDGQVLYREGMRSIMRQWPDFEVVGEASSGVEAIEFCRKSVPDLVLLDTQAPVVDDADAIAVIRRIDPRIKVVVLTVCAEEGMVFRAIANGASGYLLKDTPSRQLHDRLRAVMHGEAVLSGAVTAKVLAEFNRRKAYAASYGAGRRGRELSDLAKDILRLVARGYSNEEISEELYISTGTVKKHLGILMQDFQFKNRVQLAVYALKAGLAD